ncbi:MAG: 16S rRNA (guanine(966)-N(2))-methyltransferase RsmD [Bacteroidia bacterium]|nr:16S rRNA (guanine(966)-N(2))-methyltransferase RsmD [Bacteroidia bacterium]
MRIVAGKYRGRMIRPPKGLPVRPTTDQAKEALFNILSHRLDFSEISVLDCFSGTGNMSYEFLSRGVKKLVAVDADAKCVQFIQSTFRELGAADMRAMKMPVEKFFQGKPEAFDLIFMDPPYAMAGQEALIAGILHSEWLASDGLLILEHASTNQFDSLAEFVELRKYGGSSFSFFEKCQ